MENEFTHSMVYPLYYGKQVYPLYDLPIILWKTTLPTLWFTSYVCETNQIDFDGHENAQHLKIISLDSTED